MKYLTKWILRRKQLNVAAAFILVSIGAASLSNSSNVVQSGSIRADEPAANLIQKQSNLSADATQNDPARRPTAQATPSAVEFDERDAALERESKELAKKYRSAPPQEQSKLGRELQALNDRHFEYRQQQRKQEIERLSGRVDALRIMQLRRQENKPEVLKRRFNDLIDPSSDLSWDDPKGILANAASSPAATQDPAREMETGSRAVNVFKDSEPTYEGMTLSEGLKLLENERSSSKLFQAILAVRALVADAEPRRLVRAIFRMTQSMSSGNGMVEIDFTGVQVELLFVASSEIVAEELVNELKQTGPRMPAPAFKKLVTSWIGSASRFPNTASEYLDQSADGTGESSAESPGGRNSAETRKSVRLEVRRHSRALIGELVKIAGRDASQGDWIVETVQYILELSDQRLTMYPELIPIVERVFETSRDNSAKNTATALLAQSGLHIPEFMTYLEDALKRDLFTINGGETHHRGPYLTACNWSIRFAAAAPQTARIVTDELQSHWPSVGRIKNEIDDSLPTLAPKPEGQRGSTSLDSSLYLIETLGEIGEPAKDAIPLLRSIRESPASAIELEKVLSVRGVSSLILNGKPFVVHEKLGDHLNNAIQKIETAISNPAKPTTDSRAEGSSPDSKSKSSRLPIVGETAEVASRPAVEKTFDGIPYSQWLKMLETEVKPEKLWTAIDACSRLAEPHDEYRIAHNIFLAAGIFEKNDSENPSIIWNVEPALRRLPPGVVVDELIAALRDDRSYKDYGREFQARLLIGMKSRPIIEVIKSHASEIIAQLVQLISRGDKNAELLLCAASATWVFSERPLDDYDSLRRLSLKMIDGANSQKQVRVANQPVNIWMIVARNLVQNAADTPGLALMLMPHLNTNAEVAAVVGKLGRHAEVAVPLLVDEFLKEWKATEQPELMERQSINRVSPKCISIINAINEIGVGKKGYRLLRELCLISAPRPRPGTTEGTLFTLAEQGLKTFSSAAEPDDVSSLLNDGSLITGEWGMRTVADDQEVRGRLFLKDLRMKVLIRENDGPLLIVDHIGDVSLLPNYEIDDTKSPKHISLKIKGTLTRKLGIYELTETSLRIQLARVGEPRPVAFVADKTKLPSGEILLELSRDLKVSPENAAE